MLHAGHDLTLHCGVAPQLVDFEAIATGVIVFDAIDLIPQPMRFADQSWRVRNLNREALLDDLKMGFH